MGTVNSNEPLHPLDETVEPTLLLSPADVTEPTERPEQLSLLPQPAGKARFQLDMATRRRGLRRIAEIRAQLNHAA